MAKGLTSNKLLQDFLKKQNVYFGKIDGLWGYQTEQAVRQFAGKINPASSGWSDERRRVAVEQFIMANTGFNPGAFDGLVGPQTKDALERYQNMLVGMSEASLQLPHPQKATVWPLQNQSALRGFFGEPNTRIVKCHVPYTMVLAWDEKTSLTKFACHELVKEPFERIFSAALDHYGFKAIEEMGLHKFGGCLNVRSKRGGSSLSLHSWGIAVDLDPARNQFRWGADRAVFDNPEYAVWWEIVESEGMVSLGKERNFDWMHFQAARI